MAHAEPASPDAPQLFTVLRMRVDRPYGMCPGRRRPALAEVARAVPLGALIGGSAP